MSKLSSKNYFLLIATLFFLQLVFLFIVKYTNQELSISNFSLIKMGNIFNLFIYSGIILGIYLSVRGDKWLITRKSFFGFIVITWVSLITSFISTKVVIVSSSFYIFNQPGDKVITGLLFLLFLLSLSYLFISLWNNVFSRKKPSMIKNINGSVLLLLLFFILIFIYIDNIGYSSNRWVLSKNKKNTAVVLGAAVWTGNVPSPTLSLRVDKALELFKKGIVGKIVLTGGKAPGEMSESEVAYEYAKLKGIDSSIIVIEKYTSSTADQIKWIKNTFLLEEKSKGDIIFVSDGYHLPRVIEISKFFNLDIKVAESVHKLDFNDKIYNLLRESIALFNFWNFAL